MGMSFIVRYAEDAVLGFEHREEANRFLEQLRERLQEFGLELDIRAQLRQRMHESVAGTVQWVQQVVRGYFQYHAIPGNWARLKAFRRDVLRIWYQALRRAEANAVV